MDKAYYYRTTYINIHLNHIIRTLRIHRDLKMAAVIHIEINLMCLFILFLIAHQSRRNVNQQMKNVLFRNVVYGLIFVLILDTLWIAIDGRMFPGAIQLNLVLNGVFLGLGVLMGCMWYLYVLDTLD